ncbi:uncharacterized protein [Pleurodeles waltl]|uniref:uncharacterized protein isoform X2 n=1 Tax=Pleurodeles waltl TaxID=8319 RepID=UPI0037094262
MRSWRSFPCALRCLGKTSRRPAALRGSSGRVCGASRFPFWTICSCAAVHLAGLQVEYAGVPLSRPCPDRRGSQTAGSVAIGSTDWQVLREDMQHKRVQTNLTKPLSKKNTRLPTVKYTEGKQWMITGSKTGKLVCSCLRQTEGLAPTVTDRLAYRTTREQTPHVFYELTRWALRRHMWEETETKHR